MNERHYSQDWMLLQSEPALYREILRLTDPVQHPYDYRTRLARIDELARELEARFEAREQVRNYQGPLRRTPL